MPKRSPKRVDATMPKRAARTRSPKRAAARREREALDILLRSDRTEDLNGTVR